MRLTAFRLLALFALALPLAGAPLDAEIARFERFVTSEMERDGTVGLSVAFMKGDFVWARGFGWADLENRVPATERSSYRTASVAKPMTAIAALRLAEMGKLDLDAPVQTYVPYFPAHGKPVTVRHLLAHLGGISHYRDYDVEGRIREPRTTREAIAIFEGFDLIADPGSRYSYSSYGYNLAGAAIEAAAGKPFGEVMQELVWGPAGMTDTRLDDPSAVIPNRVRGYRLEGGEIRNSEYVDVSSRFAAGGTRSTVVDLIRFVQALDTGKLLGDASFAAMTMPQTTSAGRWISYGLGWSTYSVNGHFQISHGGSQQETRTLLIWLPREKLAMAFASNFEEADFARYRNHLYYLLTGEVWNPPSVFANEADSIAAEAMEEAFDGGMYLAGMGRPPAASRAEIDRAFAGFNKAMRVIASDPEAARQWIDEGIHPAAGQPLVVMGVAMAARVGDEVTHGEGALRFFADYIERYRRDRSIPRSQRFERPFEERVGQLAAAWRETWNSDAQGLFAGETADVELLRAFKGRRVVPDYSRQLVSDAEKAFERGDPATTARLAALAAEVYPASHGARGIHGVVLVLGGDRERGEAELRRSLELEPEGYASVRNLRDIARAIAAQERALALRLLETATALHPDDAGLRSDLEEATRPR